MEQHVLKTLSMIIEEHQLLGDRQAGFRADHSTKLVMLPILDKIRLTADSKKPCALVLLDLSAAFDTVNHGLPLGKNQGHWYLWDDTPMDHLLPDRPYPKNSDG